MEAFETELKKKNRGYLRLIVWQKALQLFELRTTRIAETEEEDEGLVISLQHSLTPALQPSTPAMQRSGRIHA